MIDAGRYTQTSEDGEHPTVTVLALRDVQLGQEVPHVRFDGPFAEHQGLGDADVGQPLGHQVEHRPLPLGERAQRVRIALGLWTTALVALALTPALALGVAGYGALLAVLGVAMVTRPAATAGSGLRSRQPNAVDVSRGPR